MRMGKKKMKMMMMNLVQPRYKRQPQGRQPAAPMPSRVLVPVTASHWRCSAAWRSMMQQLLRLCEQRQGSPSGPRRGWTLGPSRSREAHGASNSRPRAHETSPRMPQRMRTGMLQEGLSWMRSCCQSYCSPMSLSYSPQQQQEQEQRRAGPLERVGGGRRGGREELGRWTHRPRVR